MSTTPILIFGECQHEWVLTTGNTAADSATCRKCRHWTMDAAIIKGLGGYAVEPVLTTAAKTVQASQPQQPAPAEPEHVSHSLGGFRGGFESLHGRPPTEQEIWNAAIRSWRDLNPAAAVQPPVLPLTEEDIDRIALEAECAPMPKGWTMDDWRAHYIARAIEAKVRGTGSVPPSANLDSLKGAKS